MHLDAIVRPWSKTLNNGQQELHNLRRTIPRKKTKNGPNQTLPGPFTKLLHNTIDKKQRSTSTSRTSTPSTHIKLILCRISSQDTIEMIDLDCQSTFTSHASTDESTHHPWYKQDSFRRSFTSVAAVEDLEPNHEHVAVEAN